MLNTIKAAYAAARLALTGRGTVGDHMQARISGRATRIQGEFTQMEAAVWDTVIQEPTWVARAAKLEELEGEYKTGYSVLATPRRDFINALVSAVEAATPALEYRNAVMPLETRLAQLLPALRNTHPEVWARVTEHGRTTCSAFEVCEKLLIDLMSVMPGVDGGKGGR